MSHSRPGSTRAFTVGRAEGSPRERGLCRVSTRARGHRTTPVSSVPRRACGSLAHKEQVGDLGDLVLAGEYAVVAARARHDWAYVPWWAAFGESPRSNHRRSTSSWNGSIRQPTSRVLDAHPPSAARPPSLPTSGGAPPRSSWVRTTSSSARSALDPKHGHEFLLRALARIRAEADVKLLVAGAPHETHRAHGRHVYELARSLVSPPARTC
jgi:hypothetical protein